MPLTSAGRRRGWPSERCDQALADLDRAVSLKPDDVAAYKFRGFAEIGLNQWDKAVADLSGAIQKNPNDLQNYERRAFAYRGLKDYQAALRLYSAAGKKSQRFRRVEQAWLYLRAGAGL